MMLMLDSIIKSVIPIICITSIFFALIAVSYIEHKRSIKYSKMSRFLAATIAAYGYIVLGVLLFDLLLTWKMYTYDTDGNYIFTSKEATNAQVIIQNAVINDLGRNMSPIWALIVAPISASLMLALDSIIESIQSKK